MTFLATFLVTFSTRGGHRPYSVSSYDHHHGAQKTRSTVHPGESRMPKSRSGILCVSGTVTIELELVFGRDRMVYPIRRSPKARVADGLELPFEQTCMIGVTNLTPRAPIEVEACACVSAVCGYRVLRIGSKPVRDHYGIEVMTTLEDYYVARGGRVVVMSPYGMWTRLQLHLGKSIWMR